jgi:hypothetical protein
MPFGFHADRLMLEICRFSWSSADTTFNRVKSGVCAMGDV